MNVKPVKEGSPTWRRLVGAGWLAVAMLATPPHDAAARTHAKPAAPAGDLGRFEVVRVVVNPFLNSAQRQYYNDDPRYVGRIFEIAPAKLAMDDGSICTRPKRTGIRTTVPALLRKELEVYGPIKRPVRPLSADPDLTRAPRGTLTAVRYACASSTSSEADQTGRNWTGAVGFPLATPRRGLVWTYEVVLILAPAAAGQPIRASFPCAKARSASKKALCSDASLAGWDRSVAAAFRLLRDGGGPDDIAPEDDTPALVASQQAWVRSRDRCGADRQCLLDRMAERTDALMRRQFTIGEASGLPRADVPPVSRTATQGL